MSLSVQLIDRATLKFKALPEESRARLRVAIVRGVKELAARVRGKLSGSVLKPRTFKLLNSIRSEMRENVSTIYGRVWSEGVPYAGIHEFGGQTRPHLIRPKNAKALRFMVQGQTIFAAVVHHPGSRIPMRSYMHSSLGELKDKLFAEMREAGLPKWQ